MPIFEYTARDEAGKLIKGKITATTQDAAEERLSDMKFVVTAIKHETKNILQSDVLSVFKGVKTRDHAFLAIQLSNALRVGMPLLRIVESISEQAKNVTLRTTLQEVCQDLKSGHSFSDALKRHPKIFSPYFISMVQTGEITGKLDESLGRLADNIEKELEIKQKVTSSLAYPAVLAVVALGVVIFLMVYIMPKFVGIFIESKVPLPLPTQVLLMISNTLQNYWYYVIGAIGVLSFMFNKYRGTKEGKYNTDKIFMKIPVAGKLIIKICVARFMRVFSTLYNSGVPILTALVVIKDTENNAVFAEAIESLHVAVKEGQTISEPLKKSGLFSRDVVSMIGFGEESGKLGEMLEKMGELYDQEIDYSVKGLTSLFEPIVITIMGGMIGFIALSIMMPMMQMTKLAY